MRIGRKLKFKFPKRTIRLATLFSGIGAIEQSLKRLKLKHEIVFAGDIDKAVKESYFANYKIDPKDWHDDISDFNARKYKYKVDLLVGGSPCQSFSMVEVIEEVLRMLVELYFMTLLEL